MTRTPFVPPHLTSGPFTLEEARCAGLTRRQLQGSAWKLVAPRTYQWVQAPDSPLARLASVQKRLPGSIFSGLTAAWLHNLESSLIEPIEVTYPASSGNLLRWGVQVHREDMRPSEVVDRIGYPTTSVLKTVADLGRRLPLVDGVTYADAALHRDLVDLAQLREFADARRGQRGIARLRRVLELVEPLSESPMETRLRLILVQGGLPRPEAQVEIYDSEGRFLARTDLFYREARLILEYDGSTHRDSLVEDNRRQNCLQNEGYRLLRFTAPDVFGPQEAIVLQVQAARAARLLPR